MINNEDGRFMIRYDHKLLWCHFQDTLYYLKEVLFVFEALFSLKDVECSNDILDYADRCCDLSDQAFWYQEGEVCFVNLCLKNYNTVVVSGGHPNPT